MTPKMRECLERAWVERGFSGPGAAAKVAAMDVYLDESATLPVVILRALELATEDHGAVCREKGRHEIYTNTETHATVCRQCGEPEPQPTTGKGE